ncbi:hypothetical protein PCASD_09587 [Puccinia coronata f. sp. avenae]|uniref:Uncharacterized protein n=1 Tax=Puccinia coronata f. sp. avenae TaxID=200324 RepID=A0A2N5V2D7_9BASI|nr:hypothetical protein PCASD_09587 [Puccinia coronata f. sp. avenae]
MVPSISSQSFESNKSMRPPSTPQVLSGNSRASPMTKQKCSRRTKAEMITFCREQADTKSAKQVNKANLVHQKKLEAMKKKYRTRASLTANGAKSISFTQDDRRKSLAYEEFENICSYLETAQHLTDLFGDGAKTSQRMATYKKKYTNTKNFEEHTGAGVLDRQGPQTLAGLLDGKCPCYSRMDAIFCEKPNVTPMLEFNHSHMSSRLPPIKHQNNGDGSDEEMALEETEREETLDPLLVLPPRLNFESISPSGDAPAEASIIHPACSQPNPSSRAANAPEPKSKMTLASSFSQAKDRKFELLDQQIATDERRWQLERDRYDEEKKKEEKKEADAIVKEDKLRAERKEMVNELVNKGQKSSDVVDMVNLFFK